MPRRSGRASKGKRLKMEGKDEVVSSSVRGARKGKEDCGGAAIRRMRSAKEVEEGASSSSAMTESTKGPNPLENPVILNHLFQLCAADVLATCRQVCKQWYNESLITWRTNCSITFTIKRGSIFLTNREEKPNVLYVPLKKFLAYIETPSSQCSTKPYRSIKIVDCELTFGQKQFEEFWSVMADNVTTLELSNCEFSDVEDFRKITFQTCPNLKRLSFLVCRFPKVGDLSEDEERTDLEYQAPRYGEHKHLKGFQIFTGGKTTGANSSSNLPVSWLEFFSHFQSLTYFYFNRLLLRQTRLREMYPLTEAIRLVRKQGKNKLPFKHVCVFPPFILSRDSEDQEKLEIARELRLPLSVLDIGVHPDLDENYLKNTLDVHAKTLTYIEMNQEAPTVLSKQFPFEVQLNNLKILNIKEELVDSFTFLNYTPNLETLAIMVSEDIMQFDEYKYETPTSAVRNTSKEEMDHVKMERLKELEFGCIMSDEDISCLSRWMPRICDLQMILNDKQFGIVCESWRDLKKLKVLGDKLTDEGVTGISGRQTNSKRTGNSDAVASRPNITYLQKLEEFSFMGSSLTFDSVFHGFLGLPKLRRIKSLSPEMVWDNAAKAALKKKKIQLV